MGSTYIESYKDLYHGTIKAYAAKIVKTQAFIPSKRGWCGPGVYFYDNRAKAWWSARRTCANEKAKGNTCAEADIVIADIEPTAREVILDLRSPEDLKKFADFVDDLLTEGNIEIQEELCEEERLRVVREMLLNFYCKENNIRLIVGYFKQQTQEKVEAQKQFAENWQLAIGIETIYCAKDPGIIRNIRRRQSCL